MSIGLRRRSFRGGLAVIVALVVLLPAAQASADDIVVMTSGAFTAAYLELAPGFEHSTKHKLITATTTMGTGAESIPNRLARGERADVVIVAAEALEDLIKAGRIVPGSRVDLARSSIAMAVRAGARKPDISSVDGLKRALLDAKSIAYSASVSGDYLATELFQELGIADQMKGKSQRIERERVGAVVARGDAEIGFQQVSELLPIPGIVIVGTLPAEVQRITVFSAGIATRSPHPASARALVSFLASPAAAGIVTKSGMEPIVDGGQAARPSPHEADFVLKDFQFRSGGRLPELRIHYRTFGTPQRDAQGVVRNAVLIMHGTGGSGASLIRPEFAGELFREGGVLDVSRYFVILPDGIGHGRSSKPSDGLHARFPRYGYLDMVEAEYRLVTEGLNVNHLRLVMGTSMGAMHTWLWGERYPTFMDALMPLASLPTQISGRNRVWRRVVIDAIRNDPEWKGGDYSKQPPSLRTAQEMLYLMGSNPVLRQTELPNLAEGDRTFDAAIAATLKNSDANDVLYQVEASYDYDPGPELEKIRAPLLAVNSADDLINPPELGILEREVKRVPNGRAVIVPLTPDTRGHGTHTIAAVWKSYLEELLRQSSR
jgi:homoserine O-acetyltransferase